MEQTRKIAPRFNMPISLSYSPSLDNRTSAFSKKFGEKGISIRSPFNSLSKKQAKVRIASSKKDTFAIPATLDNPDFVIPKKDLNPLSQNGQRALVKAILSGDQKLVSKLINHPNGKRALLNMSTDVLYHLKQLAAPSDADAQAYKNILGMIMGKVSAPTAPKPKFQNGPKFSF